jgi:hypothetical protein
MPILPSHLKNTTKLKPEPKLNCRQLALAKKTEKWSRLTIKTLNYSLNFFSFLTAEGDFGNPNQCNLEK